MEAGIKVQLTNASMYLNVSDGTIKTAPELSKPTYFISGGSIFAQQNKIHALGFGIVKDAYAQNLSDAHQTVPEVNQNSNKKFLHQFQTTVNEKGEAHDEWIEVHEGIFTGQRKRSVDTLDEAF